MAMYIGKGTNGFQWRLHASKLRLGRQKYVESRVRDVRLREVRAMATMAGAAYVLGVAALDALLRKE